MYVDNAAMQAIANPTQFRVMLTGDLGGHHSTQAIGAAVRERLRPRAQARRDLYVDRPSPEEAEQRLQARYNWARRCRLQPFKDLALTIKAHWNGILSFLDSHLSNGAVEGRNGMIQATKRRAHGYRTARSLITMTHLIGCTLTALPTSPYATTNLVFRLLHESTPHGVDKNPLD